jgi:hypothetical protein
MEEVNEIESLCSGAGSTYPMTSPVEIPLSEILFL